jgi:hypothetical protein
VNDPAMQQIAAQMGKELDAGAHSFNPPPDLLRPPPPKKLPARRSQMAANPNEKQLSICKRLCNWLKYTLSWSRRR